MINTIMNEPSSKKILFNKSTLLSLKAELLKKQEEVKEKKQLPQHKVEYFKPLQKSSEQKKNTGLDDKSKRKFIDRLIPVDTDELEACRKSKLILEKKAELYNHLVDGAGDSQLSNHFLVDFKEKKQQENSKPETNKEQEHHSNISKDDGDGEWVEYSDSLGRTRQCLKSELEFFKKRDQQLILLMKDDISSEDTSEEPKPEKPLLVQKTNDYLQSLREKWEEKEREMLAKDKDIHYQDLLFDEARMHGVGYYAFSTNETERRKQMAELMRERQETLRAQKVAEEMRKKREELIAARVAAARARQRARAGLPPEDPNEKPEKDFTTCLLEFLTEQKNDADKRAKEEENKIKEEQEKERQKLREAYVREWDIGKEGMDEKIKKFREMTQEEYVEQQRSKRIKEFAPFEATHCGNDDDKNNTYDSSGNIVQNDQDNISKQKSWSDVRPKPKTPPPPIISGDSDLESHKGLYFSTKKSETVVKYRNYVQQQEPTPIVNELSDEVDNVAENRKCEKRKFMSNHAEIAPPPLYEYYGPVPKQMRSVKPFESDITEAYAQGSKSLEPKVSERQLSKNYDFTFD